MAFTERRLAEIKDYLRPLLRAERRSKELERDVPAASLFVGVCGTEMGLDRFEVLDELIHIRRVTNPPGVVHVARAANLARADYLGVSRYSQSVGAELAVGKTNVAVSTSDDSLSNDDSLLLGIAWQTAAMIKLRGHSTVFCPIAATASWDTVAAISDNSVTFLLLDDVPRQVAVSRKRKEVSLADLKWTRTNWESALYLRGRDVSRRFGLAFNLAYVWNHTSDLRIALVNLWSGLEALFGQRGDRPVTERLVQRICSWVLSAPESDTRALYDRRCDAVHGRWLNEPEISEAIERTDTILRKAMIRCIEMRSVPLPDWT